MYAHVSSNHLEKHVRKSHSHFQLVIFSGIHESPYPHTVCIVLYMQCYRNENPPKKLGFKLDDRLQGGTLRKSRSNNPHFPNNLPQLVFLKRFLQKKIKSWRTNGNHGISASNLLKFGKALWKFKQQSVSFSLLRSPFHPSGHLVNRTSLQIPTPFIPPRFIPCRCMSAAEMLSLDKSLSQRPGVVCFTASFWTRTTSCVLWNPAWLIVL